jgi:hypothetical protein
MLGIVAQEEGEKQGGKEEKEIKIRKQRSLGTRSRQFASGARHGFRSFDDPQRIASA